MSQTSNVTSNPIAANTSKAEISRLITNVKKGYDNAQERVQRCALMIMTHAHKYNDCSQAKDLCRAVPANLRMSLVGWFQMFSPIGVIIGKTHNDDKSRFVKKESKLYNDFDLDGAAANPWWNDPAGVNPANEKPLFKAADFYATIEKIIKREIKNATEGRNRGTEDVYEEDAVPLVTEGAEKILDFVGKLRAKQLAAVAATRDETQDDADAVIRQMAG